MNISALTRGALERGAIQKSAELSPLLEMVKKHRPKIIVEIGTDRGGTFWALCKIAPENAILVSVDLPGGPFSSDPSGGRFAKQVVNVLKTYGKPKQKLHFILADSHLDSTKLAVEKAIRGSPIDFLLIDGDHTYQGVKRDWEMYSPYVRKGGMVVFHDILHHPKVPNVGVEYVWKELKNKFPSKELVDPADTDWGGIGVLTLKEVKTQKYNPKVGLLLDLNPWPTKQPGFTGIGRKPREGVDIVQDLESFPWPFEDNSVHMVVGHYIFQKLHPRKTIAFMNELWRIIKPGGQLALSVPYAGSPGATADPTNMVQVNEMTFYYFDPAFPAYGHYEPKPWEIQAGTPQWVHGGSLEIAMRPRK